MKAIAYPQQFGRDYLILSSAGYSGLLPLIFTHFEQPFILGLFGTHQLFIVCLFIDNFRELVYSAYSIFRFKFYVGAVFWRKCTS